MRTSAYEPQEIVDEVFALYEIYGDEDYIGEPVSQLEHMSQAAALAVQEGYDDEVILAAFFHDIGHLCATRARWKAWVATATSTMKNLAPATCLAAAFRSALLPWCKAMCRPNATLLTNIPNITTNFQTPAKLPLSFRVER